MKVLINTLILILLFSCAAKALECIPPKIVANVDSRNMFSAEQEKHLGDIVLESLSGDIKLFNDEKINAYINEIAGRIILHLPDSGLEFKLYVIDYPEANAFNIAGGKIFVSRKLISFANSEDELAGVIAHELGHAVVHHGAVDTSSMFNEILNVDRVGDRKDIADKFNSVIEKYRTKKLSKKSGHENAQQLEADKIGLFGMVAAGYNSDAFMSFYDRLAETEGKTGNWFSDLFGKTRPSQKRLREMVKVIKELSAGCQGVGGSGDASEFQKWQAQVVNYRETSRKEKLPGLVLKKALSPKLRTDVNHLLFSNDGSLLLVQDDFSITVVERDPVKVLFQFPAFKARNAAFTPDGKEIVFITEDLRFERWDIASREPVEMSEIVKRSGCIESSLSPDGKHLACIELRGSGDADVSIIDTKNGAKVFENKKLFSLNSFEAYFALVLSRFSGESPELFRIVFSPDSRFVVFSRTENFRFGVSIVSQSRIPVASKDKAQVIDLETFRKADIGKQIKEITSRSYAFIDNERIVGNPSYDLDEGGLFSFPEGKRLKTFQFRGRSVKPTQNQQYVLVKPLGKGYIGLIDVERGIVASALDRKDAAIWNNILAIEGSSGKILLREVSYNEKEKKIDLKSIGETEIPAGFLTSLESAEVSDNFEWLAFSSKSRGGLWNVKNGERKMFVRGFDNIALDDDGMGLGEFPKEDDVPASLAIMNSADKSVSVINDSLGPGDSLSGTFLVTRKSLKTRDAKKDAKKTDEDDDDSGSGRDLFENVRIEIKDLFTNSLVWSRNFPESVPRYVFDRRSARMIMYWDLDSKEASAILDSNPDLKRRAERLGDKDGDYLVEIVDAKLNKTIGWLLIETGNGSFRIGEGRSQKDWVTFYDSADRVLIYSLTSGELLQRYFADYAILNGERAQVAIENFPGQVSIYDIRTGDEENSFVFDGDVSFMRFSNEGDRLIVITDSQTVYTFDLRKP
ncbi:MAG: M48 family metalloprotease [Pyrinomonadaceae bacterium]